MAKRTIEVECVFPSGQAFVEEELAKVLAKIIANRLDNNPQKINAAIELIENWD